MRDRAIACGGALLCIGLATLICAVVSDLSGSSLMLVAPIGASAVLMCAVPASPLAQPWSIVGGNTVSALMGLCVGSLVHEPVLAAGLAVSAAIAGMSVARCLHPPGGAVALLGASAASGAGWMFALTPVAADSTVLVALGWLFHRFSGHTYPHRPMMGRTASVSPPEMAPSFQPQDLEGALADMGDVFDIAPEDLDLLLRRIEARAAARTGILG